MKVSWTWDRKGNTRDATTKPRHSEAGLFVQEGSGTQVGTIRTDNETQVKAGKQETEVKSSKHNTKATLARHLVEIP